MGNCFSREKLKASVLSSMRRESIRLCDEKLMDEIVPIPDIDYGTFNRINIDWGTLGRLIPYEREESCDGENESSGDPGIDFQSLRRQLTNNKQRPYFKKLDGDISTSLHSLNTTSSNVEGQSLDKFRQAVDMWSNFKISSKAAQKLQGYTDAWSYFDRDHVPLPRSLFGSNSEKSVDSLLAGVSSSARGDAQRPSQRGFSQTYVTSIGSGSVVQRASNVNTKSASSLQSDTADHGPTGTSEEHNWLNYELVLRPYVGKDKSRHIYTCIVRPRCETSSRDKTYPIDETLVQMLGEILDPFQLQSHNENRVKVLAKIKRLLRTASNDSTGASSSIDGTTHPTRPTVHRKSNSAARGAANLRYLSTISDGGGAYNRGGPSGRMDCSPPFDIGLEDAICFNMDPNKPCQPKYRRRNKRMNRFGDMSDIPLLF